jgi:aryl-alcohol dehydrogenase-like predicted oxidoreductase
MLDQSIEKELLPFCAANDIGVVVYSPMASGLLTGKFTRERIAALPSDDWRRASPYFTEPALTPNLKLVEGLRAIAERGGRRTAELAVAWVLRRPEVTSAIVGSRRPEQVVETAGAADRPLTAEEDREIAKLLAAREAGG